MLKPFLRFYIFVGVLFISCALTNAQVTVMTSTATSTYTSLKVAFDAINAGVFTGNIEVRIDSNLTETTPPVLKASGVGGANYTSVVIYPSAEVTISGNLGSYKAVFILEDADNVIIDGRINRTGNANALTIQNTATSNSAGIWLARNGNGANKVTIRNVNIIGSSASTSSIFGIVSGGYSTSSLTTAGSNDSTTIQYCNISRAYYGIRIYGTSTSARANGIIISNNDIGNNAQPGYGSYYGYYIYYANNVIVNNNRYSANNTTICYPFYFGYSQNSIFTNNLIENTTSTSTGYGYYFISVLNSYIDNCSIKNYSSTAFYGFYFTTTSTGNSINNCEISNISGSSTMYCWYVLSSSANNTFNNCTVKNVTNSSTSTLAAVYNSSGSNNDYNGWKISNIQGNGNSYGMYFTSASNTTVKNCEITNITNISTSTTVSSYGIYIASSSDNAKIFNNAIAGIYDDVNKTSFQYIPSGIMLFGSIGHQVYHNSINLFGIKNSGNTAQGYSAGIAVNSTVTTSNIRNNSIVNTQENSISNSKSFAIYYANATAFTGSTANYNNYYVSGSNAVVAGIGTNDYIDLLALQNYDPSKNANSISVNPIYNSNTNLRPFFGSPLIGAGTPIALVTTDLDGNTRSAVAPSIGAFEFASDFDPPTIIYQPLLNTTSTANFTVLVGIFDNVAVDTINKPRLYYRKTTNANTFIDNTNSTNGWKYVEPINIIGRSFEFEIDYSKLYGGIQQGATIEYFIIAQDIANPANVGYTGVSFPSAPTSVDLDIGNFPVSVSSKYIIGFPISGTIQVGEGQVFTSLTGPGGVFEMLQMRVLTGDLDIQIVSNLTETGQIPLEPVTSQGGSWYIRIYPTGNYSISGTASPALIRIEDADKVIIDGRINATGSEPALNIINNSASSAVIWIYRGDAYSSNGAKNVIVKYCNIISGSASTSTYYGIVVGGKGGLTAGAVGNNDITIEYNNFSKAYWGIRVYGDINSYISGLKITNNTFGNNFSGTDGHYYAIYTYYCESPIISNNIFKSSSSSAHYGIYLGYCNNATVEENDFQSTSSTTIYGIYSHYCNDATISRNIMRSQTQSTFYAFFVTYNNNTIVSENDIVNTSSSTFYGIYLNYSNNSIFANNLIQGNTSTSTHYSIYVNYGTNNEVSNNRILDNINGTSTLYCIYVYYHSNGIIRNNVIKNFTTGSTAIGIYLYNSSSNITNALVENNIIQNITSSSASAYTAGIAVYYANQSKIYNNAISGIYKTTPTTSNLYLPAGINILYGTNIQVYHNSVHISGDYSNMSSAMNSTALVINYSNANTLDIRNNTFTNFAFGSPNGKHYAAIIVNSGSMNGTTIDYNNYYTLDTSQLIGKFGTTDIYTLGNWRNSTQQDIASVSLNPNFNNDIEIIPYTNVLTNLGTPLASVPNDLLGNARSTTSPSLGAYEVFGDLVPPTINLTLLTYTTTLANRTTNAIIEDLSGIATGANAPRIYFKKKTNANTYIDNTPSTDGWKYTVASGTAPNFTFTINYSLLYGGVSIGDEIEYFVVAQDNSQYNNVAISHGELTTPATSVQLTSNNFPIKRLSTFYQIKPSVSGIIEVGQGQQFTNLTGTNGAFAYINGKILVGDLHIKITSDLVEPGTVRLQQIESDTSVPYTIYIYPTTEVYISGPATNAVITFEDVDNLVFDGRINMTGNVNSLTIENTEPSQAVIWVKKGSQLGSNNGANNIILRNLNIIGPSPSSTCYGIVVGGAASLTAGGKNSNVQFLYNNIYRAYYAIRVYGTSADKPFGTQIKFNSIGNNATPNDGSYYSIYTYYTDSTVISHNTIKVNVSTAMYGIYSYYNNNCLIYSNFINNCISSSTIYGMYIGSSPYISVNYNILENNSSTSAYYYYLSSCNYANVKNNIIRNNIASSSGYYFFFLLF